MSQSWSHTNIQRTVFNAMREMQTTNPPTQVSVSRETWLASLTHPDMWPLNMDAEYYRNGDKRSYLGIELVLDDSLAFGEVRCRWDFQQTWAGEPGL